MAQDSRELDSLRRARLNWAETQDDVWGGDVAHVDGLHPAAEKALSQALEETWRDVRSSPLGVVLEGPKGVGKTHQLGWLRKTVQQGDGYFFLVQVVNGTTFWRSVLHGVVDGLLRPHGQGADAPDQLTHLLLQLAAAGGVDDVATLTMLRGEDLPDPALLDSFVARLSARRRREVLQAQDTLRALVLYASTGDQDAADVGRDFLTGNAAPSQAGVELWRLAGRDREAPLIVRDLTRLVALTRGPAVIAVDQLDTLIAQSRRSGERSDAPAVVDHVVADVTDGLMGLREVTRRTLTVVTCLPTTWQLIKERGADTVADRFRHPPLALSAVGDSRVLAELVAAHLGPRYAAAGFEPPYPTWPVALRAFEGVSGLTARALLQRVDAHLRRCVDAGVVSELTSLQDERPVPAEASTAADLPQVLELDARFEELRRNADPAALTRETEDTVAPALLSALLNSLQIELAPAAALRVQAPPTKKNPVLHARLSREVDAEQDDEDVWAFRVLADPHPRRLIARMKHARNEVGLRVDSPMPALVLLQRGAWPESDVARRTAEEFVSAGGRRVAWTDDDLRTAQALQALLVDAPPRLDTWLRRRRPAASTELARTALRELVIDPPPPTPAPQPPDPQLPDPGPAPVPAPAPVAVTASDALATVAMGTSLQTSRPFLVPVESLRKHVVVFAGTGSGKTVALRRLIEECALRGVSAIVLDPNNDLARLGDPWPVSPPGWQPGDADRAARYLATVDVVVWTPNRESGRPLAFKPLPDFAPVLDDPDEFRDAVDAAVASLAPRARPAWSARTADQGRAVLTEVIRWFAQQGWSTLPELIQVLRDVPEGVTSIGKGRQLAADAADALKAAMINDPLFGGDAQAVDPGVLLAPAAGKQARVSVISLVGLPGLGQRQSFVNQLQMALFSWVKANPATHRPLGSLLVLDEAAIYAPSRGLTPSSHSTVVLAAQARKYGLGLVLATQAPKDLDNRISANAATQLVGRLSAPAQIDAARSLARSRGGDVEGVGRLTAGQFYIGSEGLAFEQVRMPMCLTHHPAAPLSPEEVLDRARGAA